MKKTLLFLFALPIAVLAQDNKPKMGASESTNDDKAISAKAELQSRNGSKVNGTVEFVQGEKTIQVQYKFEGLGKQKNYGFHIHEIGDCSSPDAKSAGPHYLPIAPTGGTAKDSPQKHAGDMPQVTSDSNGRAEGYFSIGGLTINEENAIMGRAVVLHGGPDNPNKPAPPRISCGVIR